MEVQVEGMVKNKAVEQKQRQGSSMLAQEITRHGDPTEAFSTSEGAACNATGPAASISVASAPTEWRSGSWNHQSQQCSSSTISEQVRKMMRDPTRDRGGNSGVWSCYQVWSVNISKYHHMIHVFLDITIYEIKLYISVNSCAANTATGIDRAQMAHLQAAWLLRWCARRPGPGPAKQRFSCSLKKKMF